MRTEIRDFTSRKFDNIHDPELYFLPAINIMERTAEYFGLWETVYFAYSKERYNVTVRNVAIYLIYELDFFTLKEIGHLFSKDHTTIMHARDTMIQRIKDTPLIKDAVINIKERIK